VPRATLVNITASLLTVQPTEETLPVELGQRIASIAGVTQVAPQRIVPALVEGYNVNLIAFEPAQDFSVLSWVEAGQAGPGEGLIVGGALKPPAPRNAQRLRGARAPFRPAPQDPRRAPRRGPFSQPCPPP